MLLNILQGTGQHPALRNDLVPNVRGALAEQHWWTRNKGGDSGGRRPIYDPQAGVMRPCPPTTSGATEMVLEGSCVGTLDPPKGEAAPFHSLADLQKPTDLLISQKSSNPPFLFLLSPRAPPPPK